VNQQAMAGIADQGAEFDISALLLEQGKKLLEDRATPQRLRNLLEKPGSFNSALWAEVVELGWPAAAIAENLGGLGLGLRVLCDLAGLAGRYTVSLPIIASAVVAGALANCDKARGELVAAGSTIAALDLCNVGYANDAALQLSGDVVSGTSRGCAFSAVADMLLAVAQAGGELHLVAIDLSHSGVERHIIPSIDNARASARLRFDAVPVLVVGGGAEIEEARLTAALATAFEQLGGAQRCLELACDFARERKAFGQPIGAFQAVKHKLADFYTAIELARGCAFAALEALQAGNAATKQVAAARIAATEAYEFAARETIQVFGALGITWEAPAHHHYRRSRSLALELGASLYWRDLLVDSLAVDLGSS